MRPGIFLGTSESSNLKKQKKNIIWLLFFDNSQAIIYLFSLVFSISRSPEVNPGKHFVYLQTILNSGKCLTAADWKKMVHLLEQPGKMEPALCLSKTKALAEMLIFKQGQHYSLKSPELSSHIQLSPHTLLGLFFPENKTKQKSHWSLRRRRLKLKSTVKKAAAKIWQFKPCYHFKTFLGFQTQSKA